jgi:hypothetical protein
MSYFYPFFVGWKEGDGLGELESWRWRAERGNPSSCVPYLKAAYDLSMSAVSAVYSTVHTDVCVVYGEDGGGVSVYTITKDGSLAGGEHSVLEEERIL